MTIVLASASPRRAQLLAGLGLSFVQHSSAIDEEAFEATSPAALVEDLARAKAAAVAQEIADDAALIIAADTVVVHGGMILGKPSDEHTAAAMLSTLSGKTHEVYSGVCLLRGAQSLCFSVRSEVSFRALSAAEIARYVQSGEPMDKAGSYGIQGLGALFVSSIAGDYYNVMGLPLCRLGQELLHFGVDILKLATEKESGV